MRCVASPAGSVVLGSSINLSVGLSPASSPLHFMLDVEVLSLAKDLATCSDIAKLMLATLR